MNDLIMTIMEVIGTIAFSISGALIAIHCCLDIFGVTFIGVITAVGGGIVRDLMLGNTPPAVFSNTYIIVICALTAIVVFMIACIDRLHFDLLKEKIEKINNIFDAIGLSAFTVTGAEIACTAGHSDNCLFVLLMGMITGVGGGIFRDVLADKTPYILKKHIYALASLSGGLVYYIAKELAVNEMVGTVCAMALVFIIRMLATKYRWELPRIKFDEKKGSLEDELQKHQK
ncbi:MAG: trimeric intracellular cation channel family protein [Oscillospiraceae bacterium]|nr:trimeric intracellular cation channel family protein [Oscillospiraceae bacterium]